jgi:pyrroline-5-carboxylate reductase
MAQELKGKQVGFVGSGIMAEAMIKGLLRTSSLSPHHVMASGPRQDRGEYLHQTYGIQTTLDNKEAVKGFDIVVLSVKPQILKQILPGLRGLCGPDALVISIVAGARVEQIRDELAHNNIVRSMPNTPGQIGAGITVWYSTSDVTEAQMSEAEAVLGALGETVHVDDEGNLDMATALSGTGPAYVLLFMEAMIDAGVHLGFSRRIAQKLVLQTMLGTAQYALESPRHPATLRNEVTSPGGTSAEALYHMEKGGLRTVVSRAVWAAFQRSVALGGGKHGPRLAGRSPEE